MEKSAFNPGRFFCHFANRARALETGSAPRTVKEHLTERFEVRFEESAAVVARLQGNVAELNATAVAVSQVTPELVRRVAELDAAAAELEGAADAGESARVRAEADRVAADLRHRLRRRLEERSLAEIEAQIALHEAEIGRQRDNQARWRRELAAAEDAVPE